MGDRRFADEHALLFQLQDAETVGNVETRAQRCISDAKISPVSETGFAIRRPDTSRREPRSSPPTELAERHR